MTDKKPTDNEIIKALDYCVNGDYAKCHYECPYKTRCSYLSQDALDLINRQKEAYDHLLKVARKMHTWIFLHTGNEQAAYDEIGLSDEDNMLLGYMGEITLVEKECEKE